jgi:hypothetical protein
MLFGYPVDGVAPMGPNSSFSGTFGTKLTEETPYQTPPYGKLPLKLILSLSFRRQKQPCHYSCNKAFTAELVSHLQPFKPLQYTHFLGRRNRFCRNAAAKDFPCRQVMRSTCLKAEQNSAKFIFKHPIYLAPFSLEIILPLTGN